MASRSRTSSNSEFMAKDVAGRCVLDASRIRQVRVECVGGRYGL